MENFKTKKGTIIPLMTLQGKAYLQVAWRILWFREENPLGRIETTCLESSEKHALYTASIYIPEKVNDINHWIKLSDAVKREDYAHFKDAHEKAQTGAIGRALALCGYGTQFTDDLEEGDRLADSPLTLTKNGPRPIVADQPTVEDGNLEPAHYKVPFGKYQQRTLEELYGSVGPDAIADYIDYIKSSAVKKNQPVTGPAAEFIMNATIFLKAMEGPAL